MWCITITVAHHDYWIYPCTCIHKMFMYQNESNHINAEHKVFFNEKCCQILIHIMNYMWSIDKAVVF